MRKKTIGTLVLLLSLLAVLPTFAARSEFSPASTNNDDSCDLAVMPAATLLLPYFEVEASNPASVARTTLFTITNTGREPQIAHVTVWTDLGFPVLWFNIFLTGYDVQAINMYDILNRGIIAPPNGTSNRTTPGSRSAANDANGRFQANAGTQCAILPGALPPSILADIRSSLTTGELRACGSTRVGTQHERATGYVTVDVTSTCGVTSPVTPEYFSRDLLFDNVLLGDYMIINPNPATGNYAGGNPMVHIRAIPEGGPSGSTTPTSLPYTFYDRYTDGPGISRTIDRRQPLPSAFAARYIEGGAGGFNTSLRMWREGVENTQTCGDMGNNTAVGITEIVRFDEHENAFQTAIACILPPCFAAETTLSSARPTTSSMFPPLTGADVAGWLYLNMNNGGSTSYSVASESRNFRQNSSTVTGARQSQNWVVIAMEAEGRYATEFDAGMLGNGCSPAPGPQSVRAIGPQPNENP